MENNTQQEKQEQGGVCKGMMCWGGHDGAHGKACCGWGHGHRFIVFRVLLGVLILLAVFAAGVKLGEFKERFAGSYGRSSYRMESRYRSPMMNRGGWSPYGGVQNFRMMGGGYGPGSPLPTGTSTPR